jgi:hypothetical protein
MNISDLQKRVLTKKPAIPLLLDEFPNAAAAYSLRLLRTAYTGNCIEVRRSSDDTTQNIGFVNGVLDTASLLSFVGAGDGFVKTWYDQSLNLFNLTSTNATGSQLPLIVKNGFLLKTPENITALNFNLDGVNRFIPISNGTIFRNKDYGAVFLGFQNSNLSDRRDAFSMHNNTTTATRFLINDSTQISNRDGFGGRRLDSIVESRIDSPIGFNIDARIITAVRNWGAGSGLFKRNGQTLRFIDTFTPGFTSDTNSATNTSANTGFSGLGTVFTTSPVDYIFEAVIYNDSVIDSSIIGIEQNILTYYNFL